MPPPLRRTDTELVNAGPSRASSTPTAMDTFLNRPPTTYSGPYGEYVSGYIARRLLSRQDPLAALAATPFGSSSSPPQFQADVRSLLQSAGVTLHSHLQHAALAAQRRGTSQGRINMRQTLGQLQRHTVDLRTYLGLVTVGEIEHVLLDGGIQLFSGTEGPPPCSEHGIVPACTIDVDLYVARLAKWFKNDFMRWVDPISCPRCGGRTRFENMVPALPDERRDDADLSRVELHRCLDGQCEAYARFGRYTTVKALLHSRKGRCGEFAHLFYAIMRSAGVEARYVWNSEDHVWAEYWSPRKRHWVHVDPSEGVVDKPLMYAKGWGKKQAHCIAVGPSGMEDVTKVYVDDWQECLQRRRARGWSEKRLQLLLLQQTIMLRFALSSEERTRLAGMDVQQRRWVYDEAGRLREAEHEAMEGRISGPAEWKAMRDELGATKIIPPNYRVIEKVHDMSSSDIYMFGKAQWVNKAVLLTSGPSQTSGIFTDGPITQEASFACTLRFRMTSLPGAGAADGMALIFSRDRKLGLGGYGLGYTGLGDIGDFAVEIDTYRSQDHADDPPVPHISVHSPPLAHHRHSIACTRQNSLPFLSDGRVWTLKLVYDETFRHLTGILNSTSALPGTDYKEEVGLWEVDIPRGGDAWYVGVTASCGGLWQKQEVLEWTIETIEVDQSHQAPDDIQM